MNNNEFNLNRFKEAQNNIYGQVLLELRNGKKQTHWMWFIFPQIAGLGRSPTAIFYAIKNKNEAIAYLNHPILGKRLIECVETIISIDGVTASQFFGFPDDMKLKSSMTLFSCISHNNSIYHKALAKYFNSDKDDDTLKILQS